MTRYEETPEHAKFSYSGYISQASFEKAWSVSDPFSLNDDDEFLLAVLLEEFKKGAQKELSEDVFFLHPRENLERVLSIAAWLTHTYVITANNYPPVNTPYNNFVTEEAWVDYPDQLAFSLNMVTGHDTNYLNITNKRSAAHNE